MTNSLPPQLEHLIVQYGDWGTFLAMFLESSVIPIPSELVIAGAGAVGVPLADVVIFGGLGSVAGAMVGYALGRYAGLPVIINFGKYIFIKPHHIEKAQNFAQKHGAWGVLLGRLIPIIPFKVFSIAAGLTKIPFVPFVIFTAIGVVPRLVLLALFGAVVVKYTKITLLLLLAAGLLYWGFTFFRQKKTA